MAENTTLAQRIKAEFDARTERQKATEQQKSKETSERDGRLAQFGKVCEDLKAVWRPRLEEFTKQFGEKVKITPSVSPSQREAKVAFITDMATMNMTLSVAPSTDATKLVLDYDLLIIPIFFDYERHARMEMPLDKVDKAAVGKWIDDQLVSCVKAYLSMQENRIYIERSMVEDPVTKTKLLREDAKAKLELDGRTYYFGSEQSLKTFKEQRNVEPEAKPAAGAAGKPPNDPKKTVGGADAPAAAGKAPAPGAGKR